MRTRRVFLAALASVPLAASAALEQNAPADESIPSLERRLFKAINFQRLAFGCQALELDDVLAQTAREHSERMVRGCFFGHQDPERGDLAARLDMAGIAWQRCAENIFRERDYPDPVSIAVVEWMYSEGHRSNLLTPEFRLTGIGMAAGADGTIVATQQFIVPRPKLGNRPRSERVPIR